MSSVLKQPQWEKDLVIGYHKEAQELVYPSQIPSEIANLCFNYYHEQDYFYKCEEPDSMEISEESNTVTVIKNGGSYACGEIHIGHDSLPMIYVWTFQICNRGDSWLTSFGITNANYHKIIEEDDLFESFNADRDEVFDAIPNDSYRFANDGEILHCDELGHHWDSYNGQEFNNDIIQMSVDISAGSISYQINGKDQGVAFKGINFGTRKYRMFLYAGNPGESIELIEFKRIFVRKS